MSSAFGSEKLKRRSAEQQRCAYLSDLLFFLDPLFLFIIMVRAWYSERGPEIVSLAAAFLISPHFGHR